MSTDPSSKGRSAVLTEKTIEVALTYDDVLLVPGHSRVLPGETRLDTRFTRRIRLC